jgi:Thioredoxin
MRYLILLGIIGIALVVAFFVKRPHNAPHPLSIETPQISSLAVVPEGNKLSPPEIVLGNQSAKDTVIMYFAPTCHHCSEYEKTILPNIDKEFIQSGKIKFVMRILPFHSLDFSVGKMALFYGKDRFQEIIKLFLENQDKWLAPVFEEEQEKEKLLKEKITEISQKLNMDAKKIEDSLSITHEDESAFVKLFCLENGWSIKDILSSLKPNPELEKSLASSHLIALKKDGEMLDYVPAFYINDDLQDDWVKPETLREDLEEDSEENHKPNQAKEEKPLDQSSQPSDHTKSEAKAENTHDLQNQMPPPAAAKE